MVHVSEVAVPTVSTPSNNATGERTTNYLDLLLEEAETPLKDTSLVIQNMLEDYASLGETQVSADVGSSSDIKNAIESEPSASIKTEPSTITGISTITGGQLEEIDDD